MNKWVVELTPDEVLTAYQVGSKRQHYHAAKGSTSATPNLSGNQVNDIIRLTQTHIIGVMGEIATAKRLNLYWSPAVTWEKDAVDVGGLFETRSMLVLNSKVGKHDLPLRPTDKPHPHVLCWVNPPLVCLMGWMTLSEWEQQVDKDVFWVERGKPPFWAVPKERLNKMDDIEVRRLTNDGSR